LAEKQTFPEKSIGSPSLTVHNDQLWMAWTGEDNNMNVGMISNDKIENQVHLSDTSEDGPCKENYYFRGEKRRKRTTGTL
jgi:hypothetical protein